MGAEYRARFLNGLSTRVYAYGHARRGEERDRSARPGVGKRAALRFRTFFVQHLFAALSDFAVVGRIDEEISNAFGACSGRNRAVRVLSVDDRDRLRVPCVGR